MKEAAVELLDAAIVSCPPYCRRRTRPIPMAAKADERAFVFYGWVAGYGPEPTLERPTDDARERRFVAEPCLSSLRTPAWRRAVRSGRDRTRSVGVPFAKHAGHQKIDSSYHSSAYTKQCQIHLSGGRRIGQEDEADDTVLLTREAQPVNASAKERFDVVVIGAGLAGCTTARLFALKGLARRWNLWVV
jgi:hypothetical protein